MDMERVQAAGTWEKIEIVHVDENGGANWWSGMGEPIHTPVSGREEETPGEKRELTIEGLCLQILKFHNSFAGGQK